jgi:hypothetical protein
LRVRTADAAATNIGISGAEDNAGYRARISNSSKISAETFRVDGRKRHYMLSQHYHFDTWQEKS